jgi:hypothetical protein
MAVQYNISTFDWIWQQKQDILMSMQCDAITNKKVMTKDQVHLIRHRMKLMWALQISLLASFLDRIWWLWNYWDWRK